MKISWNKFANFWKELFFPSADRCPVCSREGGFCESCRSSLAALRADETSAFYYDGIVKALIHQLKFKDKPYLADFMGEIMAEELTIEGDVITAVPLHPRRKRQRGYNQSRDIAKKYGECKNIPYEDLLRRIRNTPPQSLIKNRSQRIENIRDAFVPISDNIKGRKILLVDDVITTGATIEECRRMLINAGAAEVKTISFARGKSYGNSQDIAEKSTGKRSDV